MSQKNGKSNWEEENLKEIARLNQRGGRMLSIVDLLDAGTVNLTMAAYLFAEMQLGTSLLTAANPNGAGKTTLLGALLNLLSPEIRIVTVTSTPPISPKMGEIYLAHELGSGPYYGYIWGRDAARWFALSEGGLVASCMHADTLEEMKDILLSPPLNVSEEHLSEIGLILFMRMEGRRNPRRRVSHIYAADCRGQHRLVFSWQRSGDSFRKELAAEAVLASRHNLSEERAGKLLDRSSVFLSGLREAGVFRLAEVRERILSSRNDCKPLPGGDPD